jgi:hypothetical protein
MCTGYGREGSSPDLIQYHEEQTIVFLMAVGRLRVLCERLITMAGYPKDTPVGIIERAGCPEQRTVIGDMQTIADIAEKHKIKAPSTIVVGKRDGDPGIASKCNDDCRITLKNELFAIQSQNKNSVQAECSAFLHKITILKCYIIHTYTHIILYYKFYTRVLDFFRHY